MKLKDPTAYSGVTPINADHKVGTLVRQWEQTGALWEKHTGEDKEETTLDVLVVSYARDFEMENTKEKENRHAKAEMELLIAACLRKDATETLSKKRVLEDVDLNAADGKDEVNVARKWGKPVEEVCSSLKMIFDMLCVEEKQAEG
ncbi:hypothetical protein M427DRAFT_37958 [Gonapodya prolifera JEL478]|uniref:Uncharacterized protein n=1 Tax=Gonapodya prolifera (strain JEL478) TaxID=1344416 RepID=A0A138ZZV7_GONPJ|nr:hypothetical protein M427DRAFT_37958 [Gonapodya prolifera JEL478]|eukprot:KXS10047.1 hypothetical protein M427DRAFT_37958 [Gonapodya prolifera JEL478]